MAKLFKIIIFVFGVLVINFVSFNAHAQTRDKLVIGITQFPATMHPIIDSMVAKSYVLGFVQRPLTLYNQDWELECMMCTELPSFENGRAKIIQKEDGTKTVTAKYTLDSKAKWGDGTPITTKDILFSWEVGKHPATGASNFELFSKDIEKITVHDDYNFTIQFEREKCDFAGIDDFRLLPAHLEKAIFDKDPATYRNRTLYDTAPATAGLYFGPYIVQKVEVGASFTLVKNPYWWKKSPAFNKVIIKIIENSAALGVNLLSGDIDYIPGELGLMVDEALSLEKRLKRMRANKFNVVYKTGLVYEHIDINLDNPKFDIKTRKALLYGINRDAISRQLFGGKQPVAHVNIHPLDNMYHDEIVKYEYSPIKANNLLDKAGWQKSSDGFRYNSKGEKLEFSLMTTAGNRSRELVQQAIQSDWKKIGVSTVIDNEPARVLFGQTIRERKFKDGTMYAWTSAPNNIPKTTLHSTMIPTAENNYAGQNYVGIKNTELDSIIDDLEVVCTTKENKALWHRLQSIYAEELPALPLYYRTNSFIIPIWLKNIRPTGHQYPSTLWVEEWSVSK